MKKKDNNHNVYINKNGEQVLRVSEVIKTLSKDQLTVWANNLGLKGIKYWDEMKRTSNIGSLVHNVLDEYYDEGLTIIDYSEYDVKSEDDVQEVLNALKSFVKWYTNMEDRFHIVFREQTFVGLNVGGTIDLAIQGFKDPKKVIFCDYKTSSGIYLTMLLQLAGYVMIYEELNGKNTVEGVMVIQMDKKHGKRATAKFLSRKKMNPYIYCFERLLENTYITKKLQENYWEDCETIF